MGCTGYAGQQLVNILLHHNHAEIVGLSSNTYANQYANEVLNFSKSLLDIKIIKNADFILNAKYYDLVFTALPHKTSMEAVSQLLKINGNLKIVDLSADYRFKEYAIYEDWYDCIHIDRENLEKTVYGLCELNRESISKSQIVGNPGCYPTSVLLGILPIIEKDFIDINSIIIDSKSGYSGAGVKPEGYKMFTESMGNSYPYGNAKHRHLSEMEDNISKLVDEDVLIQFTPNLIPVKRGIISNIYINLTKKITYNELLTIYQEYYLNESFVEVYDEIPKLSWVIGTNNCLIGFSLDQRTNRMIITSTIDNLIKGAAGQAVQNMNLMYGLNETEGLEVIKVKP